MANSGDLTFNMKLHIELDDDSKKLMERINKLTYGDRDVDFEELRPLVDRIVDGMCMSKTDVHIALIDMNYIRYDDQWSYTCKNGDIITISHSFGYYGEAWQEHRYKIWKNHKDDDWYKAEITKDAVRLLELAQEWKIE